MAGTQEYKLTEQGSNAPIKPSIAGQTLKLMQTGHKIITAQQLNYELGIANGADVLNELVGGGYVEKVPEKKPGLFS